MRSGTDADFLSHPGWHNEDVKGNKSRMMTEFVPKYRIDRTENNGEKSGKEDSEDGNRDRVYLQ